MIVADCHLHTNFSADGHLPPEQMIEAAIEKGLSIVTITDHVDFDFPQPPGQTPFDLPRAQYLQKLRDLKERCAGRIEVLCGVEMGLQTHLEPRIRQWVEGEEIDFVIGSTHLVEGEDPYQPSFYETRGDRAAHAAYLSTIASYAAALDSFDSYGHLDYMVRYGPNQNRGYRPADHEEVVRAGMRVLIEKGKALELNTAPLMLGLGQPHPHPLYLKWYKEMGGELITVGSDAHRPAAVGGAFQEAAEILKAAGFRYYAVYRQRQPAMLPLE